MPRRKKLEAGLLCRDFRRRFPRMNADRSNELSYDLPWRQGIPEFTNGPVQLRMANAGSDLRQRYQHKASFLQGRMRYGQAFASDGRISEQQNVDVDAARALFPDPYSSNLFFDLENCGHELLRGLFGIEFDYAIQEPGLRGEFDRFGFVERRNLQDFSEAAKAVDSCVQIGGAVTEVRAKREIDDVMQSCPGFQAPGYRVLNLRWSGRRRKLLFYALHSWQD